MREIKFRGRSGDRWHVGDLIHDTSTGRLVTFIDVSSEDDKTRHSVNPATVGQFTGLHDADGRDIFEGDVLSNGRDTVAVSYSIEFAAFVGLYNGREDLVLNLDDCIDQPLDELKLKVIGNVYDNPNLLEVEHD